MATNPNWRDTKNARSADRGLIGLKDNKEEPHRNSKYSLHGTPGVRRRADRKAGSEENR
jgi:hypothetical protein